MRFKPLFACVPYDDDGKYSVRHNCNGMLEEERTAFVSREIAILIEYAIEEGKRRRSEEINLLLGSGYVEVIAG